MTTTERTEAETWEAVRPLLTRCGATDAEIDAFISRGARLCVRHRYADATRALGRFIRQLLDRKPPMPDTDLFA